MKNGLSIICFVAVGLFAVSVPTFAHHGGAIYDTKNPLTMKATVTDFQFVNPHVQIYFDAKDEKGNVVHWACETISPGKLVRGTGWSRDVLKPGDEITITLFPAKAGTPVGNLRKIVFADGHELTPSENAPTY
jgi:hypothetical protein